jgi:hypothetical protein
MRDLNRGAKDHLRPIFLNRKPKGLSASKVFEAVILALTVPVSVRRVPEQKGSRRGVLE